MQTETEVRSRREILMNRLKGLDGESFDAELAKNLIHTLSWILDERRGRDGQFVTSPPDELLGWVRMRMVQATFGPLQAVNFVKAAGVLDVETLRESVLLISRAIPETDVQALSALQAIFDSHENLRLAGAGE